MIGDPLRHFRAVWLVDFEYYAPPGERPETLCMAALELRTHKTRRLSREALLTFPRAPFPVGPDSLFIAFYASAELGCFLDLGWPFPDRVLDLFCEFRNATNGRGTAAGNGLLGALAHYGLPAIDAAEKSDMRDLAARGGPYTPDEMVALMDYCWSDVEALAALLPRMLRDIDLPRALLRGRYMAAAARIESHGVPIDDETLGDLRRNWTPIKSRLVREVDHDYGVYVPNTIDAKSRFGAAVLAAAEDTGIDPYHLADAATEVWRRHTDANHDLAAAIREARKASGLTVRAIEKWEESGYDHSTWPHLDDTARDLAGRHPELGIGRGYTLGEVADDFDHAAALWELLRKPDPKPINKSDPAVIEQAIAWTADASEPADAELSFSTERFAEWLADRGIPWPRTETGQLSLSDDTFRQMARRYPEVAALRELRHSLSELRLESLAVGSDGRNRCMLSAFRSLTGRNQPSNAKFVFGPSCWLRGLIRPAPGRAVAYVDWSQQEFGIAAALSGDSAMIAAYASGDPYLAFAIQAGLAPADATKQTHPAERERCKICILAVQYGMGEDSLAQALGQPPAYARRLLQLHRSTYPRFWKWSQAAVDHAMLRGWLHTVFGWRVQVGPRANPRSLANFPMQANGAEMLRLACCVATERGIEVCAPVHDALLIEGPAGGIEVVVGETQAAMREASRIVLDGFELRSDAKIVRHPDRYMDPRGERMWETVSRLLAESVQAEIQEPEFV